MKRSLLPLAVVALLVSGPLPRLAAQVTEVVTPFETAVSIAGGEAHWYRVELAAGELFRGRVEQQGIDLVALLFDPQNQPVGEPFDSVNYRSGPEVLEAVAPESGTYQLAVSAGNEPPDVKGSYRLVLEAPVTATAADRQRVAARQEAFRLYQQLDPAVSSSEREELAALLPQIDRATELWRRTGIRSWQGWGPKARGIVLGRLGRLEEAAMTLRQAVALHRDNGNRADLADALLNLGLVVQRQEAYEESLPLLEEAAGLHAAEGNACYQASALHNLGYGLKQLGRLEEAEQRLEAALALFRPLCETGEAAPTLSELGAVLYERGDPQRAVVRYEEALESLSDAPQPALEGKILQNRAVARWALGQSQAALSDFEAALPLLEGGDDRSGEAAALLNLTSAYVSFGQLDDALRLYRRSLALFTEAGDPAGRADALLAIGWVHHLAGDEEQAQTVLEEAVAASRTLATRRTEAWALTRLAAVRLATGGTEAASTDLAAARQIFTALGDRAGEATVLADFGLAKAETGEVAAARELYRQALAASSDGGSPLVRGVVWTRLAALEHRQGRLEPALAAAEQALAIDETLRTSVVRRDLQTSFLASRRARYELAVEILLELDRRQPAAGYLDRAFQVSERARARQLSDLLAEALVDVRQGIDPELKRRGEELEEELSAVQARWIDALRDGSASEAELHRFEGRQEALRDELRSLEAEVRQKNPRYAEVRYPEPPGLAEVQALLADDAVLLEYVMGAERAFLLAVTPHQARAWDLGPVGAIQQAVAAARQGLERPSLRNRRALTAAARRLYDLLLAPAKELTDSAAELLVVPDGDLYLLPFEILLRPQPAGADLEPGTAFALRRWRIGYVPSAGVLAALRERAQQPQPATGKELVAFADPVYREGDGASGSAAGAPAAGAPASRGMRDAFDLPRLLHSGEEVDAIAALFPPGTVTIYRRQQAAETVLKASPELGSARRLHFATHGLLSEDDPEAMGLVLSLVDEDGEDGLLQMHEIFNLKLSAELAVLSACSTGLGRQVRGEGIVGLSRAFLYAGVPRLVVSLWQVDDAATRSLMESFYRHLLAAAPPAEALRLAKLELSDAYPSYWAPFVLIGLPGGGAVTDPAHAKTMK